MSKQQQLFNLHTRLTQEALDIMVMKNHDYASGGGDPFANFRGSTYLGIHPVLGMQLRQQDKMARVKTFVEKGELRVKGESVKDAILDQINYLVLQYAFIQFGDEDNDKGDMIEPEQLELFPRDSNPLQSDGLPNLQEDVRTSAGPHRYVQSDRGVSGYDYPDPRSDGNTAGYRMDERRAVAAGPVHAESERECGRPFSMAIRY